ncbi:hypothetical protein INR49_002474 [Caranx melampygus]|nr:hypothetical protein INR49_002474 [Caranx melampygus]
MDAAESGARTLGTAATTGSKPLLDIIEPQLATVNQYALKGLEKMEEKLPILHQPADKVVSDTVGMVYQSVTGAKDAVVGAVMGGVELTRAAVSGGISTVMGTRMGQMVSSGMGLALSRSEDWVNQNLQSLRGSWITSTLDLLESARASLGTASNQIGGASEQLLQRWTEWKQNQAGADRLSQSQMGPSNLSARVCQVLSRTADECTAIS